MGKVHKMAIYALILLSVVHIGMTQIFFDQFTMRVMWYVAQGLMGLFVSFLNIACRRLDWDEPIIVKLTHLANILGLTFVMFYAVVDTSPPSFVAIGLFVILTGSAFILSRGTSRGWTLN